MAHQKAMVQKMLDIEKNVYSSDKAYAIMCDKPGSGKSYAILAFLYIVNKVIFKHEQSCNVIVVPFNIYSQWKKYIETMYGDSDDGVNRMRYKVVTEYSDIMKLYTEPKLLVNNDLILTTSLYFNVISTTLKSLKIKIKRIFFDEADTIESLLQSELHCNMTWFVSASIHSLFKTNNVSIGKYTIDLNVLLNNQVVCDPSFIDFSIVLPDPIYHLIKIKSKYHSILSKIFVFDENLSLKPDKSVSYVLDTLMYNYFDTFSCASIPLDSEWNVFRSIVKQLPIYIENNEKKAIALNSDIVEMEKKLRQRLGIDPSYDSNMNEQITKMKQRLDKMINLKTNGENYMDLLKEFLSSSISDKIHEEKINSVKYLLQQVHNKNGKCILFSDQDYIFKFLRVFMSESGISFTDLDGGNIETMNKIINDYKSGKVSVLFADSTMYSCGMNLENTTDIIFLHNMDPLKESQVIGRAQRFGRKEPLHVFRFSFV